MSDFLLLDDGTVKEAKYRAGAQKRDAVAAADGGANGGSGQPHRPPAAEDGKTIRLRPRTKYEQSIMDRIPERQKLNLMKPQVVGGKQYTGIGFLPTPSKLQFLDFSVGDTVKQVVQLTNVSQGFNAFKVLPPPPLFRDVLEVVYTPQSMMSAGMSCSITVIFTPKEAVDIDTELTIQCQTGFVSLPVQCRRKRVKISSSTSKLDFGAVVVAETVTRSVTITNDGALGVKMTVGGDVVPLLVETHVDSSGDRNPYLRIEPEISQSKATVVSLKPFSSTTLTLTFAPMELCSLDSNLYLSFDDREVDDVVIFVVGKSVDVPVFVAANSILDFHCCFYGTLYRDTVTVQNTLGSAAKVSPDIPPSLRGMLEFVPKFGFVQPGASLDFQVKFTPNEGLGAGVDTAVKLVVADQAMPIFFQLKASLSKLSVTFSPTELQFGVCCAGEMLSLPLKITNGSRVSKRLGFVKIPTNVKVLPQSVFHVAPEETVEVQVAVSPPTAGQFTQNLQLTTEHAEVYNITVTGHGKSQSLVFSQNMLKIPPCTIGQSQSATTLLTNRSNATQRFSFVTDRNYGVSVAPQNGTLEKGQSLPIMVTFLPTTATVELELPPLAPESPRGGAEGNAQPVDEKGGKAAAGAKKKSKAEEEQEKKDRERAEELRRQERDRLLAERERLAQELAKMEPWEVSDLDGGKESVWSKHRTVLIPCYVEGWSGKAAMLGVRCCVVRPTVSVSFPVESSALDGAAAPPPTLSAPSSARTLSAASRSSETSKQQPTSALTVDFGEVPADDVRTKVVVVQNLGNKTIHLLPQVIDPFGPFRLKRPALPQLKPNQVCEVEVEFKPANKAVYSQQLTMVVRNGNNIVLNLLGEGLPAALSISADKANANAGAANQATIPVAMGYSLVGERVDIPLYFTNFSPFPLSIQATFLSSSVHPFNPNGTIPFSLTPKQLVIPANGKVEVVASFSPLTEGPYTAKCEVEFGGDRLKKTLVFDGFGCDRGIVLVFPPHEQNEVPRGPFTAFGDLAPLPGSSAASPYLVTLTSMEQKAATQQVLVVNNKGSANGEFTVEGFTDADAKSGWKVEPLKANVAGGQRATITVTFSPTQALMDSLPIPKVSVISLCNLRVVLKGGTPSSDGVTFVRCKGTACR